MSNQNHTPGPWQIHPAYREPEILTTETEPHVSFCDTYISQGEKIVAQAQMLFGGNGGWPRVESRSEMLANAALIAAAPELLNTLECAWLALGGIVNRNERVQAAMEKCEAAIAKAKGIA